MTGNLFWLDLETTGLNPLSDTILEVGFAATTPDLEIIAEDSFLVQLPDIERTMGRCSARVQEMHDANGLWMALATEPAVPFLECAAYLRSFIEACECSCVAPNGDPYRSPLCGSTVSFDRGFVAQQWPSVLEALSYRNVDVSSIHELAQRWYGPGSVHEGTGPSAHRALADVQFSIARLRWYRARIFSPHSRIVHQGPTP